MKTMEISMFNLKSVFGMLLILAVPGCAALTPSEESPPAQAKVDKNASKAPTESTEELLSYNVPQGQDLRTTLQDLAVLLNFTRAIIDWDDAAQDPSQLRAQEKVTISVQSASPTAIKSALVRAFPAAESLYVGTAVDKNGSALVLSNRRYEPWDNLILFEVYPGTLQENARRMAERFGWNAPERNYWQTDITYDVKVQYAIVSKDVVHGFSRLFEAYPLQARLVDSTKQVVVVKRNLVNRR